MRSDLAAVTSAAIIATMSISTAASANDTEAEIGIGGLTFTKSANVEILSEDLYVSREQIVVKYLFRNTSRQDVDSLVAFPLPEFKYSGDIAERSGISDVEFTTQVDGEPVASKVEKKAYLFGTDVTSKLELSGIPLNPDEAVNALETISQETKSKLKHFELLDDNGSPTWTVKTTYYWQQLFPAGRQISIEHRYKPTVGGTVASAIGTPRWQQVRSSYSKYCIDQAVLSVMQAARPEQSENSPFKETWVSYILTTGANWAAPIRNFHAVVDKGHTDDVVSFCADGVRQITPTEFEFSATNFIPKQDLNVLILTRWKASEPTDTNPPSDFGIFSCDELWFKRNSLYKTAGYCFRTRRAIQQFGNAGCTFDDVDRVPFSEADRALIDQIKSLEQSKRCPR